MEGKPAAFYFAQTRANEARESLRPAICQMETYDRVVRQKTGKKPVDDEEGAE